MIDFRRLNTALPALAVLQALGLEEASRTPTEWRGKCPFHASECRRSRSLAVSLESGHWYCHNARCHATGDLIDLWSRYHSVTLHDAARRLASMFSTEQEEER